MQKQSLIVLLKQKEPLFRERRKRNKKKKVTNFILEVVIYLNYAIYYLILGINLMFQLRGSDVQKKHTNHLLQMAQELKMGPQQ